MNGLLAYIESYFNGQLQNEERIAFENRCVKDSDFAKHVAFYVSARHAIKNELLEKKQTDWKKVPVVALNAAGKTKLFIWLRNAVAACVIIAGSIIGYNSMNSPKSLAKAYIKEQYNSLGSMSMSGITDSIELGKQAFNNNDYNTAEKIFSTVATVHPENAKAKELAGLVYIQTNNYDKAISYFDSLANMKNLYSNPGMMLKATTLIIRNKEGDVALAKSLLEIVITNKLAGKEAAERMLKKI